MPTTVNAATTGGIARSQGTSGNTGASTDQENFDIVRNQGSGTTAVVSVNANDCDVGVQVFGARGGGAKTYRFRRVFFAFDTSSISGTVSAATLKLDCSRGSIFGGNATTDIIIVKANKPDTSTNLATGDFDDIPGYVDDATMSGNVTDYSAEVSSFSNAGTYTEITLNAAARADIQNNSTFTIGIIDHDNDYTRTLTTSFLSILTRIEGPSTSNPPQIVVTEAATGYTHNVLGVAAANIAKVNGVATANIDKINGVD